MWFHLSIARWRAKSSRHRGQRKSAVARLNIEALEDRTMPRADLSVSQTHSPEPVFAGQNIAYTLTVQNNGPDDALNVELNDFVDIDVDDERAIGVTPPAGWTITEFNALG